MSKYHSDKVYVVCLDQEDEKSFSTKAAALSYCLDSNIESEITVFDSKKEYRRWGILKDAESRSAIINLQRQVPYLLVPTQYEDVLVQLKTKQKTKRRRVEAPISYKADFQYNLPDGSLVVEDVKSKATRKLPEYIIKRKLMLYVYGIKLTEII